MSVFVIAEIGSVHDGNFASAKKLIALAKKCGADAVKFQTHIASAETLRDAPMPPYFKGEPRYEYFERTGFSLAQWKKLRAYADKVGIEFMSSPFSIEAVDLLEQVGVKRYKIPSGEITNIPFLKRVGSTRKPVILSSGMSSWDEIDEAVTVFRKTKNKLTILQCTTEYPCPPEHVGLNILTEMRKRYRIPVGISDHTLTPFASLAAVTLGAEIVEKHLTSSRTLYGSDAKHSLEPEEFRLMVDGIRAIEKMLRSPVKKSAKPYAHMKEIFEKSVVTVKHIPRGKTIDASMLGCKKPGTGIPAREFDSLIGKKAARDLPPDTLLTKSDFQS
jgi:N-acetylneuraminate synthase